MANNRPKSSERDWWLGLWDWATMTESAASARVQVSIKPGHQRGFWQCEVRLVQREGEGPWQVVAKRSSDYPNADSVSMGAHLMNEVIKLDKEVTTEAEALLKS